MAHNDIMAKRKYFLEGLIFNNFTVKEFKKGFFHCVCVCGNSRKFNGREILSGKYKSCGCKSNPNRKEYLQNFKNKFWSKVIKKENGCLEWNGSKRNLYGRIGYKGKILSCHRLSWEWQNGEIPKGLQICHKCDNPSCVNPDHLFLGSHTENMRDCFNKNRNNNRKGSNNSNSKLNEHIVSVIRNEYLKDITLNEISKKYNVSKSTISRILKNKSWRHV